MLPFVVILLHVSLVCKIFATPLEPADGKILLGAWLDTAPSTGDTPVNFNNRIGKLASFFQFAEDIPLNYSRPVPIELLEATESTARLYLTVYPPRDTDKAYAQITDQVIANLSTQISSFVFNGRQTFIRLMPEMNGNWNPWGQQPIAYKNAWKRIVTSLRTSLVNHENDYAIIWAPSVAQTASSVGGYPFIAPLYRSDASNVTEFDALDTNKDGVFDSNDDPYSPYYPGDEWVDWIGASTYYYGVSWPWVHNQAVPLTTLEDILNGYGRYENLYETYCERAGKPMFITETAAAFYVENVNTKTGQNLSVVDPGVGELSIKRAFWSQYITNATFLDSHPKLKAICLFEFAKVEDTTFRDYRMTVSPDILAVFKDDLNAVSSHYEWSIPNATTTNSSTPSTSEGFKKLCSSSRIIIAVVMSILYLYYQ